MAGRVARRRTAAALILAALAAVPVLAQATTGVVTGTVRDEQGAVVPGATVALISSARGTRVADTQTNANGDFVFPNVPGDTYNLEITAPVFKSSTNQPVMRADYQLSSQFRVMAKYAAQWAPRLVTPGSMPGVNDTMNWNPNRHAPSVTVNHTMTPTTFVEASYGYSFNEIDILDLRMPRRVSSTHMLSARFSSRAIAFITTTTSTFRTTGRSITV